MDAFFASVEQRDDPSLRGVPTLVAGRPPRGVVQAASYEARVFGCRSAMPTGEALRLCPHARVVRGNFDKYRAASGQAFEIFRSYTPLVQPLSIDEAFLDVGGSARLFGDGPTIAADIRRRVLEATGLTCSVGVAPNKFLAKLASDLDKPDGLTVIPGGRVGEILSPLPVGKLWGVGPAAQRRLGRFGVKTIGDLREMPDSFFDGRKFGEHLRRLAFGVDDRPVVPERKAKSVGSEQTFGEDIADADELRGVLLAQTEHVARRLRRIGRAARCVTVKLRTGQTYRQFHTVGRRRTLDRPTQSTDALWAAARELFDAWAAVSLAPLRLIGVTAGELTDPPQQRQAGLFDADERAADERSARVDSAVDAIVAKLGPAALHRGLSAPARRRGG